MLFLRIGWFSNALRTERPEYESISLIKQWYFLEMLSSKIILEKKPLKILHNLESLEMVLRFSIRLIFSPFTGIFLKKGIIVFQKAFFICNYFLYPDYWHMMFIFCSSQQFFTKISLKFEVILIIFSSVIQKLIS